VVKAKKSGSGEFSFSSSAVRANDGLGSDILTSKNVSEIQVAPAVPKETIKPKVEAKPIVDTTENVSNALKEPTIISSTHPDNETWYSRSTATFNWDIPSTATSIQTFF
jgi:hypothetical protein